MKSFLVFIALLSVVILSSNSAPSVAQFTRTAKMQRAVMQFNEPVELMGLLLKGEYLFVHNEEAMLRGEACTYVYRGTSESPGRLVISFHCTPAARDKARSFTVRTRLTASGKYEVTEFQFAGDTEAHRVPANPHAEHVNIASLVD